VSTFLSFPFVPHRTSIMFRLSSARGLVNSLSPAYAAALALICIQVGIGLVYKASQTGGK